MNLDRLMGMHPAFVSACKPDPRCSNAVWVVALGLGYV